MERFVPTDNFRKKSNTFRGIAFFSLLPKRPEFSVPFVHITRPWVTEPARTACLLERWRIQSETSYVQVYTCENCYYASPLMADFLVHNCEITDKKDGHFECLYFFTSFFNTNRRSCLLHAWRGKLKRISHTLVKISNGTAYSRSVSFSKKSPVQWNLDLTKSLGTGQICSLNGGFVISKTSI